jgi:hypothetical protein
MCRDNQGNLIERGHLLSVFHSCRPKTRLLAVPAVPTSRVGSWPKFNAADLVRPIGCLLLVMACSSLLAGVSGYFVAKADGVQLVGSLAYRVPAAKHVGFLADLWAHLAAYGVGFFGGIGVSIWVLFRRRQLARTIRQSV